MSFIVEQIVINNYGRITSLKDTGKQKRASAKGVKHVFYSIIFSTQSLFIWRACVDPLFDDLQLLRR